MCAVDQKRPFFPRAGPFLDLLPFTGPPYGKAPYGEASYGKAGPLQEAPYEEGAGVPYGSFTEKEDEEAYGKAPYGEASYEKAPYELQESLRETMGRDFTRIGREFPLVCRRPKKPFFPRAGPFLDLLPFEGPFSLTGALTGPPYGKAPYGEASYGKAGPLQEAPYEEGRSLREGPGSRTGPLTGPPYGKAPYGEASYGKLGPYRKPLTRRDGPYGKGRGPVWVLHREG